jgi:hypothetical protein
VSKLFLFEEITSDSPSTQLILGYLAIMAIFLLVFYVRKKTKISLASIEISLGSVVILSILLGLISVLPFTSSYYYLRYFSQYTVMFHAGFGLLAGYLIVKRHYRVATVLCAVVISLQLYGVSNVLQGIDKTNNQSKALIQQLVDSATPGDIVIASKFDNYYDAYHYLPDTIQLKLVAPHEDYGSLLPIERIENSRINLENDSVIAERVWYFASENNYVEPPEDWVELQPPTKQNDTILELYRP